MSRTTGSRTISKEARRKAACDVIDHGATPRKVAEAFDVTPSAVHHWVKAERERREQENNNVTTNGNGALALPEMESPAPPPTETHAELATIVATVNRIDGNMGDLMQQVVSLTQEKGELEARIEILQDQLRAQVGQTETYRAALTMEIQRNAGS